MPGNEKKQNRIEKTRKIRIRNLHNYAFMNAKMEKKIKGVSPLFPIFQRAEFFALYSLIETRPSRIRPRWSAPAVRE